VVCLLLLGSNQLSSLVQVRRSLVGRHFIVYGVLQACSRSHTKSPSPHLFELCVPILQSVKIGTRCQGLPPPIPLLPKKRSKPSYSHPHGASGGLRLNKFGRRLNKFVRRLHDMLQAENNSGVVEWRRGLLVLYSTDAFAKKILPKYFNTWNIKTFRRQVGFPGFLDLVLVC
jgi:hypothetical protein